MKTAVRISPFGIVFSQIIVHSSYYNCRRVRGTLKTTPAVAAGRASCPWTVRELI